MKIRNGFVTNSSSTNFMIISKKELTLEYLMKKLGFKKNSKIYTSGYNLTSNIIDGTNSGVRWFEVEKIDYETVSKIFGQESAEKFKKMHKKGYHTYLGHIGSDEGYLTAFVAMDSFIIDDKDFYMDGRNCVW